MLDVLALGRGLDRQQWRITADRAEGYSDRSISDRVQVPVEVVRQLPRRDGHDLGSGASGRRIGLIGLGIGAVSPFEQYEREPAYPARFVLPRRQQVCDV